MVKLSEHLAAVPKNSWSDAKTSRKTVVTRKSLEHEGTFHSSHWTLHHKTPVKAIKFRWVPGTWPQGFGRQYYILKSYIIPYDTIIIRYNCQWLLVSIVLRKPYSPLMNTKVVVSRHPQNMGTSIWTVIPCLGWKNVWTHQPVVVPPNIGNSSNQYIYIYSNWLVVSTVLANIRIAQSGSIYIGSRPGSTWSFETLRSPPRPHSCTCRRPAATASHPEKMTQFGSWNLHVSWYPGEHLHPIRIEQKHIKWLSWNLKPSICGGKSCWFLEVNPGCKKC